MKSSRQMMVFMSLVFIWIGQFCHDVIGHQNMKVVVIGQLLFCCYFQSIYCLFVGKVQVAVNISSEVKHQSKNKITRRTEHKQYLWFQVSMNNASSVHKFNGRC